MASPKAAAVALEPPPVTILTRGPAGFQPMLGSRKLVIKNLRRPASHAAKVDEYYAQTEKDLGDALQKVFAGKRPGVPLERLYRGVEDVCRSGKAENVYHTLNSRVDAHLQNVVLPRIKNSPSISNIEVLQSVLDEWNTWNSQTVREHLYESRHSHYC